ncbi:hypothetical protein ACFX11_025111 [Malus domestica]
MALEESVLRSSFIVLPRSSPDGPWINNINKSTHPTVLQDQAQQALEDPFITVIQDQALTALEETLILKIKPQRLLEDPLKSTFKDQAHGPLEETSNSSSKIKPRRPLDQRNIHKSIPYGDRIRGSK